MSPAPAKRSVRSAADLQTLLHDPNPVVRLGVLKQIGKAPDRALAYGKHEGLDVIDLLIRQIAASPAGQMRQAALLTLANFRDPRAVEFLMVDLPRNDDTQVVVSMIVRLAEEASEPVRKLLVELLDRDPLSAHARTAASVLAWWPDWEPDLASRLRMSLLSDVGHPLPPPFDDDSAELWLAQLQGTMAAHAWEMLELQGLAAFAQVGARWDALDDAQRLALLQWGGRRHLEQVAGMLRQTLASGDVTLILEALRLLALLPEERFAHQERLHELWSHPRLDVRCAVLRAGLGGLEWERLFAECAELSLQREIMVALVRERGPAAVPFVLDGLQSTKWQIRSTATRLAVELGDCAVEGLRGLTRHDVPEVRLAACQALIDLGQEQWLEETFL